MSRISFSNIFNSIDNNIYIALPNQFNFFDQLKIKASSQNFITLFLVAAFHFAILFGILYQSNKNSSQLAISFTATVMDFSAASSNIVATAASVANQANYQAATDVEKSKTLDFASVKAKATGDMTKKSNDAQAHNSIQQNAVISANTSAVFDAAYLNNPSPSYPALSRRFGEQGLVMLDVFVNENGKAESVRIKKTSGFDRLDFAALETVKKWRFLAAKQGEKFVSSWVQVPVNFVLEK